MSSKPTPTAIVRLSDLKPGERGTFFAVLAERTRSNSQANKLYYTCRFKDLHRTVTYMVWSDGPHFTACDTEWQTGQFFKVQAIYGEHPKYGSQLENVEKIRFVNDRDAADGFEPSHLVERSRFEPDGI